MTCHSKIGDGKMKILWLCNIILPDFCEEFQIKKSYLVGWMTAMLHQLEKKNEIEISMCFPIYDRNRLKDGVCNGHKYFTFLCDFHEVCTVQMIQAFEKILEAEQWDIIHIWGTEFAHTLAMLKACGKFGLLNKVVINIQGLAFMVAKHYRADIPKEYWIAKQGSGTSMEEEQKAYERRGVCEIESIKNTQYVIGRTDWDRACIQAVNPKVQYFFCGEILREVFYKYAGTWKYEKCEKYSIFVSQATYPIKGFHYLLCALPYIIQQYPNTHVYAAGANILTRNEPYAAYLISLIDTFRLKSHITFLGLLDEMQMIHYYQNANVFVSSSVVENESNSLHEAQILGVPCVCSYVGGAYNRIVHEMGGFLYPHDEPVLLAYYVCKLFENKDDLCERLSLYSAHNIQKYINPQENADTTVNIYRKIQTEAEKT